MAYDVIVIGGGTAGVSAALRASELGASVALVERHYLGGAGMNDGCVPVRVLAKAARAMRDAQQFDLYGLDAPLPTVDFARLLERAQQVVYEMHEKKQLVHHLTNMQVAVYENGGDASFVSSDTIQLGDGRRLSAQKFIICVGGHSRRLQFPGSDYALTYNEVWNLTSLPKSLIVVGGGAIGCQLASIFNAFGTRVTLLNTSPRILGMEDDTVADAITDAFGAQGIEIIAGITALTRIEKQDGELELVYDVDGQAHSLRAEAVVTAAGWPGNIERLNVTAAGVEMKGPYIAVNGHFQTSAPHVYAAGDITGQIMLVQTASHQARYAAEHAVLGSGFQQLTGAIPHGSFTDPEYAGVGLTETQARKVASCVVAVVPYADMDRAVIDDHTVGFCKLIVDAQTHRVLGAHVVGEQAVEVVQIVAAAMGAEMPVERLAAVEFAYPTFAGIIGLAARQIAIEMQWIPVEARWQGLSRGRVAEWERTAGGTKTGLFAQVPEDFAREMLPV